MHASALQFTTDSPHPSPNLWPCANFRPITPSELNALPKLKVRHKYLIMEAATKLSRILFNAIPCAPPTIGHIWGWPYLLSSSQEIVTQTTMAADLRSLGASCGRARIIVAVPTMAPSGRDGTSDARRNHRLDCGSFAGGASNVASVVPGSTKQAAETNSGTQPKSESCKGTRKRRSLKIAWTQLNASRLSRVTPDERG